MCLLAIAFSFFHTRSTHLWHFVSMHTRIIFILVVPVGFFFVTTVIILLVKLKTYIIIESYYVVPTGILNVIFQL